MKKYLLIGIINSFETITNFKNIVEIDTGNLDLLDFNMNIHDMIHLMMVGKKCNDYSICRRMSA